MQFFIAIGVLAGAYLAIWVVQSLFSVGADVVIGLVEDQFDKKRESKVIVVDQPSTQLQAIDRAKGSFATTEFPPSQAVVTHISTTQESARAAARRAGFGPGQVEK